MYVNRVITVNIQNRKLGSKPTVPDCGAGDCSAGAGAGAAEGGRAPIMLVRFSFTGTYDPGYSHVPWLGSRVVKVAALLKLQAVKLAFILRKYSLKV
jgi:hypothetical protein